MNRKLAPLKRWALFMCHRCRLWWWARSLWWCRTSANQRCSFLDVFLSAAPLYFYYTCSILNYTSELLRVRHTCWKHWGQTRLLCMEAGAQRHVQHVHLNVINTISIAKLSVTKKSKSWDSRQAWFVYPLHIQCSMDRQRCNNIEIVAPFHCSPPGQVKSSLTYFVNESHVPDPASIGLVV